MQKHSHRYFMDKDEYLLLSVIYSSMAKYSIEFSLNQSEQDSYQEGVQSSFSSQHIRFSRSKALLDSEDCKFSQASWR